MGEFTGSIDYFVDRSRVFANQNSHRAIVLHGTGGSASQTVEQLGDFFRTTPNMASTHYGIGRDGRVAQYVRESDGAAGNGILEAGYDPFWDQFPGNKNLHTLSVETINDSANSLPLTEPQKTTLFRLVKYWVDKYGIPVSHIKGHFSLQPANRARCPGPNFPWQELFNYLKGETKVGGIPQGWRDENEILTAPNGMRVVSGFRKYVLEHAWDPVDVPLNTEYGANPVEQSNTGLGGGTAQDFRMTRLCWTSKMGVYKSWNGQELAWYQKTHATLQRQVDKLIDESADLEEANTQLKAENADLREQLSSGKIITQEILDDISIIDGNVQKLKSDVGVP